MISSGSKVWIEAKRLKHARKESQHTEGDVNPLAKTHEFPSSPVLRSAALMLEMMKLSPSDQ